MGPQSLTRGDAHDRVVVRPVRPVATDRRHFQHARDDGFERDLSQRRELRIWILRSGDARDGIGVRIEVERAILLHEEEAIGAGRADVRVLGGRRKDEKNQPPVSCTGST